MNRRMNDIWRLCKGAAESLYLRAAPLFDGIADLTKGPT